MTDERREELSRRVADGEAVDWQGEAEAEGLDDGFLEALRVIERLARTHRETATPPGTDAAKPSRERWSHLEILEPLGAGSYGRVYRARDPYLDRDVALKLLGTPNLDEGRLLAEIRHPNVVTVFGSARHDGKMGLWMELIEGRNLAEIVETDGPFGAREAALIAIDVCRALAAVHRAGILHRDVKAQNVMREVGGRIVLTDFGIGRRAVETGDLAEISGTPVYLAPEVVRGEPATGRSEVYSVGVLLFFLVTGRFPVEASSFAELVERHRSGERNLLGDLRPGLPDGFVETVQRALSEDPEARFATIGRLQEALADLLNERRSSAGRRSISSLRRGLWAAAILIAVVGLGLVGWWLRSPGADRRGGVPLPGAAAVATCVDVPANAVAWWPGDGHARDIQGENSGTPEADVSFGRGLVGEAFDFSWGIVRVPNRPELEPQELSIEAWVYPRSVGDAPDSIGPIIVAMDLRDRFPTIAYTLAGPGTNGNYRASVGLSDGTDPAVVSKSSFPLSTFHHVAMTWNRRVLTLYVDGQSEGEVSLGEKTVLYEGTNVGIGAHPIFPDRRFDGLIDEVAIYDRALSAGEIRAIYEAGSHGKCKNVAQDPSLRPSKS